MRFIAITSPKKVKFSTFTIIEHYAKSVAAKLDARTIELLTFLRIRYRYFDF